MHRRRADGDPGVSRRARSKSRASADARGQRVPRGSRHPRSQRLIAAASAPPMNGPIVPAKVTVRWSWSR